MSGHSEDEEAGSGASPSLHSPSTTTAAIPAGGVARGATKVTITTATATTATATTTATPIETSRKLLDDSTRATITIFEFEEAPSEAAEAVTPSLSPSNNNPERNYWEVTATRPPSTSVTSSTSMGMTAAPLPVSGSGSGSATRPPIVQPPQQPSQPFEGEGEDEPTQDPGQNTYWQQQQQEQQEEEEESGATQEPQQNSYWSQETVAPDSTSTLPPPPATTIPPLSSAPITALPQPPPSVAATVDRSILHLVLTEAPLLSGSLTDCASVEDASCEGGVAAVAAFVRHFTTTTTTTTTIPNQQQQQPTLVFPKFEKDSQFVQVHPLGWSVNRLILQGLLGWTLLMSTPSLLLANGRDNYGAQRDLTYLQDPGFPFLLTNVQVPPSSSWGASSMYHQSVHFDATTGIALLSIANSEDPLNHDQIQSAWGALWIVADRNAALGAACIGPVSAGLDTAEAERQELFASYQYIYGNGPGGSTASSAPTSSSMTNGSEILPAFCWLPIVVFDDSQPGNFQKFISGIMQHPHPPAFIVDVDKQAVDEYPVPRLVHVQVPSNATTPATATTPMGDNTKSVWIHSFGRKSDMYYQHSLQLSSNHTPPRIQTITLMQEEMEVLPEDYRDKTYASHITFLRHQADQAIQNDPQIGYSTQFPVARVGEYRRCQGGECEIGNLFTDAMRWKAKAHVAFTASGGLRGEGWPAGPVRISHLWSSFPFPNSLCTGVMSGISLFQMMDYSIQTATFEGDDTNDGERLLQLSGLQVVYNTEIPHGSPRIVSIHVWDHEEETWLPIQRLSMYKFATDSYMCSAYDPYPDFLGANGNFTLPGEEPGVIGDDLIQNTVAEYLTQLDGPYDAGIKGRLVNNTEVFEVLDLVQSQETCPAETYWSIRQGACLTCPDITHVGFTDEQLTFEGQIGYDGGIIPSEDSKASSIVNSTNSNLTDSTLFENVLQGRILLVNRELSNFSFIPRAMPPWLRFIDMESGGLSDDVVVGAPATLLPSASSIKFDFIVGDSSLQAGTATGTVSFDMLAQSVYPGDVGIRTCSGYRSDATFDVFLRLSPPQEQNYLGDAGFVGIILMCVALATAVFLATFLMRYRTTMILKTMQPVFLITVCCGVFIMALTILPLSLDDEVLTESGADAACMATPWLLSMGMTVIFSALFSKLWRVNKLFSTTSMYKKQVVTERDVLAPFILMFSVNTLLLICWNVIDPLRLERLVVDGEEWKSYAACRANNVGYVCMYCIAAVNMTALVLACWQAFRARNISDEFSESKNVGLAVGCWLQVLLIGVPSMYLVAPEDMQTSYFLRVGLIWVLCMTMMVIIFGPLVLMVYQFKKNPASFQRRGSIASNRQRGSVSGLEPGLNSSYNMGSTNRNSFSNPMASLIASGEFHMSDSSIGDRCEIPKPLFMDKVADLAKLQEEADQVEREESVRERSHDKPFLLDNVPESFLNEIVDAEESLASAENDSDSSSIPFSGDEFSKELMMDSSSDDSSVPFSGDEFSKEMLIDDSSDDAAVPFANQNGPSKLELESSARETLAGSNAALAWTEAQKPKEDDPERKLMESSVRDLLISGASFGNSTEDGSISEATTPISRREMPDKSDPGRSTRGGSMRWPKRKPMSDRSDPTFNRSLSLRRLEPEPGLPDAITERPYPWEHQGQGTAEELLGYDLPEIASIPKKKKKHPVKKAIASFNQSLSALSSFGPHNDADDDDYHDYGCSYNDEYAFVSNRHGSKPHQRKTKKANLHASMPAMMPFNEEEVKETKTNSSDDGSIEVYANEHEPVSPDEHGSTSPDPRYFL